MACASPVIDRHVKHSLGHRTSAPVVTAQVVGRPCPSVQGRWMRPKRHVQIAPGSFIATCNLYAFNATVVSPRILKPGLAGTKSLTRSWRMANSQTHSMTRVRNRDVRRDPFAKNASLGCITGILRKESASGQLTTVRAPNIGRPNAHLLRNSRTPSYAFQRFFSLKAADTFVHALVSRHMLSCLITAQYPRAAAPPETSATTEYRKAFSASPRLPKATQTMTR